MRFLLLFFCLFFLYPLFGQSSECNTLIVKGITTGAKPYESIRLSKTNINVYESNTLIDWFQADEKGRFEFEIPLDSYIIIEFKKDGFFAKRILFDTRDQDIDYNKVYDPFNFEIILFAYYKDLDFYEIDFPVTRVEYSSENQDFVFAEKYTERMVKKQQKILNALSKLD